MPAFPLESTVAVLMKEGGYRKTGRTWHKVGPDTTLVLNLQKSQWSDTFYINLGVYIRALGREARPACQRCHINTRLETVVSRVHFEPIRHLTSIAALSQAHEAALRAGLAWLEKLSTSAAVVSFLSTPLSKKMLVFKEARQWATAGAA